MYIFNNSNNNQDDGEDDLYFILYSWVQRKLNIFETEGFVLFEPRMS